MVKIKDEYPTTTVVRNPHEIEDVTGNIYLSVLVAAKRADQIQNELREELNNKLASFLAYQDPNDENADNTEQVELAKHYELLPKPSIIAIEELLSGEISFRVRRKKVKKNK